MLEFSEINYWAILVAWLISDVIGWLWYSPMGFGNAWTKLSGVDIMKLPPNEANRAIGAVVFASMVQAVVLAVIVRSLNVTTAGDGLLLGVFLWLGLVAATTVGTTLYARRSWKFWWLNGSFFLVTLSVNGMLLAVWN